MWLAIDLYVDTGPVGPLTRVPEQYSRVFDFRYGILSRQCRDVALS